MTISVKQMQRLVQLTTSIRMQSWKKGPDQKGHSEGYGHYRLSVDEAAIMACRRMRIDQRFAPPIAVLVFTGYCDVQDWAAAKNMPRRAIFHPVPV